MIAIGGPLFVVGIGLRRRPRFDEEEVVEAGPA
jgi:hypothetical protein